MPSSLSITYPPLIQYGWGLRSQLADHLRARSVQRPLLVTTKSLSDETALREWQQCCGRDFVRVIAGIPHDPSLQDVDEIIGYGRKLGADAVIAIGGGS